MKKLLVGILVLMSLSSFGRVSAEIVGTISERNSETHRTLIYTREVDDVVLTLHTDIEDKEIFRFDSHLYGEKISVKEKDNNYMMDGEIEVLVDLEGSVEESICRNT